jgi:hypothetical protein
MLNDIGAPNVNGKDLTWTVSGSSNGDPAQLVVRINGGAAQVIDLGSVGSFSLPISATASDYDQDMRIDVTLQDPSPGGRGTSSKSRSDRSGPPPPPVVAVGRGKPCNDDPTYGREACQRGAEDTFRSCTDETCSRIRLGLYGWDNWTSNGKVSCRVVNHPNNWFLGEVGTLDVPFEDNVGWYSPGGYVQIACRGNKFGSPEFYGAVQW